MRTLFLIILFHFVSSTISLGQNLKIRFINKTGKEIKSLVINGTPVGDILADSTSKYRVFKKVRIGGGHLEVPMKCLMNKEWVVGGAIYDPEDKDAEYISTGTFTYRIVLFRAVGTNGKLEEEKMHVWKVEN